MELEKEILMLLESEKLYDKNLTVTINKLSNLTGMKKKEIEKKLDFLVRTKKIRLEDDKIQKIVQYETKAPTKRVENNQKAIGTIINQNGTIAVKLRGHNEFVCPLINAESAKNSVGKTCLVKIVFEDDKMKANLEDVFGFVDDPISENIAIASKYGFTNKFTDAVHNEALQIPQEVTDKQREGRVNLEHIPFITIDPEGCKDKDDAVFDEPVKNGFKAYIAIADVSSGVIPNTELDKEAMKRGNSAYLGGGVYPMLPPELSNGIFSLDEGKPRLALVASAIVTYDGKIENPRVEYAVINVKKSYSYPEAEKTYNNEDGFDVINKKSKKTLDFIYKNTKTLENVFSKMLEFDSHEPAYKFGENGKKVEQIFLSNEEYSHKVIETRMILANEIVAQFFKERGYVGLYRTHEGIKDDKAAALQNKLQQFGIEYTVENNTESIQNLIEIIKNHPARDYLMSETIKSLSKAGYTATEDKVAHFGLGVTNSDSGYMHFTSPIRRYADLITHRLLKEIIAGKKPSIKKSTLEKVAEHLNIQEKKADWAERESDEYLACMWAESQKGNELEGYISQINDTFVKVMTANGTVAIAVPLTRLYDANHEEYKVSKNGISLNGKTHKYTLGDTVKFKVVDIDLETRMIFGDASEEKVAEKSTTKNTQLEEEMLMIKK